MDIQRMILATDRSPEARHCNMVMELPCFLDPQGRVVECSPTAIAGAASKDRLTYPRSANFGMVEVMDPLEESRGKQVLLVLLLPRSNKFVRRIRGQHLLLHLNSERSNSMDMAPD
jgi:hypothetical protein